MALENHYGHKLDNGVTAQGSKVKITMSKSIVFADISAAKHLFANACVIECNCAYMFSLERAFQIQVSLTFTRFSTNVLTLTN